MKNGKNGRSGRNDKYRKKLRPLHLPSPIPVRTDARGRPTVVGSREGDGPATELGAGAREKAVVQIREIWRIDDEWWRDPISRLYFETVLEDGKRVILYRDLVEGGWYVQRG